MTRFTEEDLKRFVGRGMTARDATGKILKEFETGLPAAAAAEKLTPKPSKHRNRRCVIDGIKFESTLEAAYYLQLEYEKEHGLLEYYLRQVPLRLPGGVTYWCDYLVFPCQPRDIAHVMPRPRERWIDTKGRRTQTYINKVKQVKVFYPTIDIIEITAADIDDAFLKTARELRDVGR